MGKAYTVSGFVCASTGVHGVFSFEVVTSTAAKPETFLGEWNLKSLTRSPFSRSRAQFERGLRPAARGCDPRGFS